VQGSDLLGRESRLGKVDVAGHRLVLRLCTRVCSPCAIGATTLPMSTPYSITVSPGSQSFSAGVWPIGVSLFAVIRTSLSSSGAQRTASGFTASL